MRNRDLKKQLISESKIFVPDLKNKIYASVGYEKSKPKYKLNFKFKPVIAFLVLFVISLSFFIKPGVIANSYVIVQINPSIELEVNEDNKIIAVNPLNSDGYFFLESLNIKDKSLEEAIDLILVEANLQGYLQEETSKVTAYAVNKNKKTEDNVNGLIKSTIEKRNPNVINNDEGLKIEAKQYDVSVGRMLIIKKAIAADSSLTINSALKMEVKDLVYIINSTAKKSVEKFENQYKENIEEIKNKLETSLDELDSRRETIEDRIEYYEDLIESNASYNVVVNAMHRDFVEYKVNLFEIHDLEELLEDIEDFYDDYFDFLEEVLKKNYENQKDVYKNKISENSKNGKDDFSFDFDDNISSGKYNQRFTEDEKDVIRIINRISILMNNKYPGANKRIEEFYEEFLDEIEDLSFEFKNSEIVLEFETKYNEYMKSK